MQQAESNTPAAAVNAAVVADEVCPEQLASENEHRPWRGPGIVATIVHTVPTLLLQRLKNTPSHDERMDIIYANLSLHQQVECGGSADDTARLAEVLSRLTLSLVNGRDRDGARAAHEIRSSKALFDQLGRHTSQDALMAPTELIHSFLKLGRQVPLPPESNTALAEPGTMREGCMTDVPTVPLPKGWLPFHATPPLPASVFWISRDGRLAELRQAALRNGHGSANQGLEHGNPQHNPLSHTGDLPIEVTMFTPVRLRKVEGSHTQRERGAQSQ
eukprot:4831100-Pleurochrysis_carterae.AAC.4